MQNGSLTGIGSPPMLLGQIVTMFAGVVGVIGVIGKSNRRIDIRALGDVCERNPPLCGIFMEN